MSNPPPQDRVDLSQFEGETPSSSRGCHNTIAVHVTVEVVVCLTTWGGVHIVWGGIGVHGGAHIVWGDVGVQGGVHIIWGDVGVQKATARFHKYCQIVLDSVFSFYTIFKKISILLSTFVAESNLLNKLSLSRKKVCLIKRNV